MEILKEYDGALWRPTALEGFKCIGPACSDSCCVGWEVEVDQATYKAYQTLSDQASGNQTISPLAARFNAEVMANPACTDANVDFALMRLTPNKRCPFLASTEWCDIQSAHGEALLSVTCHLFPRTYQRIDGVLEQSMTLSCPEVARLVLGAQGPLVIEAASHMQHRVLLSQDVVQESPTLKQHPAKALTDLRGLALNILGQQGALWLRLAYLNSFHIDLMPLHVPEGVDKIKPLVARYQKRLAQGLPKVKGYQEIPTAPVALMSRLYREMPGFFEMGEGEFLTLQREMLQRFATKVDLESAAGEAALSKLTKDYQQLVNRWVMPFAKANAYFFENYLRHFVFKFLYPFSEDGDPYTANTLLVLRLQLAIAHLAALGEKRQGLALEDAIWVIQQLTKLWEHNRQFFIQSGELMMAEGLDGPEALMSLVPRSLGV